MNLNNYISNNIVWDGPDISCLQLCKGDVISDIVYKVATKICELFTEFEDLKDIDFDCIINKCDENLCFEDYSIYNLLKILQVNDCSLKELLDNTIDIINDKKNIKINVDLSCLKTCPTYNNPKYVFLCAYNGNTGDEILVNYKSSYDNIVNIVTLKKGQCLKFDYPKNIITIISSTVLTPNSNIQVKTNISVGFENCIDCESNINQLVDSVTFPGFHKQKEISLNTLLQYLIYRVCCQDHLTKDVETKLILLENLYQSILNNFQSYKEPLLTTCINSTSLAHSLITPKLSTVLCDVRGVVGTTLDISKSISNQCEGSWITSNFPQVSCLPTDQNVYIYSVLIDGQTYLINTLVGYMDNLLIVNTINSLLPSSLAHFYIFNGQIGYNNVVSNVNIFMTDCDGVTPFALNFISNLIPAFNLAQDSQNQWKILCNILKRVKEKENSACCLPDCGEVKIGFRFVYSSSDQIYKLIINSSYGTSIKEGWIDNGSVLTITDNKGIKYIKNIEITEDVEIDLDLDGLNTSEVLNASIKSNFIHTNGLICKELYVDHLEPINSECSFCKLCAYGSNNNDRIKVNYFTDKNKEVVSHILTPGSCIYFKLPEENPTITSLVVLDTNSDIILAPDPSSNCDESIIIPEAKLTTCWFFAIPMSYGFEQELKIIVSGSLLSPYTSDFDLNKSTTNVLEYDSLITSSNPNGISLSGKTLNLVQTTTDKISAYPQTVQIVNGIKNSKSCSGLEIKWTAGANGNVASWNENTGTAVGPNGTNSNFDFVISINQGNSFTGQFGIIIEIEAQDENIIPELILLDPITSNKVIVKGVLAQDDCNCL